MPRPALLALVLVCAGAALAPGASDAKTDADITGAWGFVTQTYGPGCKLTGSMVIRRAGAAYSCSFSAREQCTDIDIRAEQTCTATRQGDELRIDAKVKRVTPQVDYVPDNFVVTIRSGAHMVGALHSFHDAPVEFYRGDAPVS